MTNPVTREHVVWAYRLILGREPENDDVVTFQLEHAKSVADLRDAFLRSDEFAASRAAAPEPGAKKQSIAPRIEAITDAGVLQTIFDNTARVWEGLGKAEPHWSVLTAENYRADQFKAHEKAFFDSGLHEVNEINSALKRNGLDWPATGACLEYGCGVGRVTWALASKFERVYGIDISAAHLAKAREHLSDLAPGRTVELRQVSKIDDLDTLPDLDFFYSRIVLQHNPPPVIERILNRLMQALQPGGIGVFQVPTMIPSYEFSANEYLMTVKSGEIRGMEMHMLTQQRVFELVAAAGCRPVEVWADRAAMPYQSHTFLITR